MARLKNPNLAGFEAFQRPSTINVETPAFGQSKQAEFTTAVFRQKAQQQLAELEQRKRQ